MVRPSSVEKPRVKDLKARSIHVVSADLQGPQDELINILKGIDVVISAIHYQSLSDEIPLSIAAKAAGVKRYVPCFFATVAPRGVMYLRDSVSNKVLFGSESKCADHFNRRKISSIISNVYIFLTQ